MKKRPVRATDYSDPKVRKEILVRQRRGLWTPEQVANLARHFKLRPGLRLLDAGCGQGYGLSTFGRYCLPDGELIGVDIEETLLSTAQASVRRSALKRYSRFARGDVYRLPFRADTFDVSMAHVVLCHLAEPEKALDELIRVTRPKGCIVIFDNALSGGGYTGWDNISKLTIKQRLFLFETNLRGIKGKVKLGKGDLAVGCYVPSWMEKRGLRNVDVRCNERVTWAAPPYRSPGQRVWVMNMRERARELPFDPKSNMVKEDLNRMRAGGCSAGRLARYVRWARRTDLEWRRAVKAGSSAFAFSSGGFWCIWGFKP